MGSPLLALRYEVGDVVLAELLSENSPVGYVVITSRAVDASCLDKPRSECDRCRLSKLCGARWKVERAIAKERRRMQGAPPPRMRTFTRPSSTAPAPTRPEPASPEELRRRRRARNNASYRASHPDARRYRCTICGSEDHTARRHPR